MMTQQELMGLQPRASWALRTLRQPDATETWSCGSVLSGWASLMVWSNLVLLWLTLHLDNMVQNLHARHSQGTTLVS